MLKPFRAPPVFTVHPEPPAAPVEEASDSLAPTSAPVQAQTTPVETQAGDYPTDADYKIPY